MGELKIARSFSRKVPSQGFSAHLHPKITFGPYKMVTARTKRVLMEPGCGLSVSMSWKNKTFSKLVTLFSKLPTFNPKIKLQQTSKGMVHYLLERVITKFCSSEFDIERENESKPPILIIKFVFDHLILLPLVREWFLSTFTFCCSIL